jgi:hypothetical protein
MTDDEKLLRRIARSAAKKNAKVKEQHPLFAEVLEADGMLTTPKAEYWRWRRNVANAAENVGTLGNDPAFRGLKWIELLAIERHAATFIPAEDLAAIIQHMRHTYPMPAFGPTVWCGILCGKQYVYRLRVEFRPELVNQWNRDGRTAVPDGSWPPTGWTPPHTPDSFWEMFPYHDAKPEDLPDDGVYEKLQVALMQRP